MAYSLQVVKINTMSKDAEYIQQVALPIANFAKKHDVTFKVRFDVDYDCWIAFYQAEGKTLAYCRGMISEIKQRLKDVFKCRLYIIYQVY